MRRREWIAATSGALAWVSVGTAEAALENEFLCGLGLSINDKPLTRAVTLAAGLGARSIRIDVPWTRVEDANGELRVPAEFDAMVDQCVTSGIQPLLILAYGHPRYGGDKPTSADAVNAFTRYAAFVVSHFKGKVRLYDLWNEWNTHTGKTRPGSAEDYVQLAASVYKAVKAVDPSVRLLSGGISDLGLGKGWIERFLELGGHKWVDGISIHPYNWFYRNQRTPEAAMVLVDELISQLDAVGATAMPVYVTEVGWPSFSGRYGRTDAEVESYLSRFMLLAASRKRVAGVWWYCLRDQGQDTSNKEHRFGLLQFNYERKPIAANFEQACSLVRQYGRPAQQAAQGEFRLRWGKAGAPAVEWQPQGESAVKLNGLEKSER
jgi:hypothetical protein